MSTIGQPERATQNRIIALFRDELRHRYFRDWTDRPDNSNPELVELTQRRDKTHALKQGMIQELLTGRIRLI